MKRITLLLMAFLAVFAITASAGDWPPTSTYHNGNSLDPGGVNSVAIPAPIHEEAATTVAPMATLFLDSNGHWVAREWSRTDYYSILNKSEMPRYCFDAQDHFCAKAN
jgi:hypothetical protein